MEEHGWEFHVSHWEKRNFMDICGNSTWYGFYNGNAIGSIYTNFKGHGFAILRFGNCWPHNEVSVYLNGYKIEQASGNVKNKEVHFDFSPGDQLKVTEDGAIIKLHSLILTCNCKYV